MVSRKEFRDLGIFAFRCFLPLNLSHQVVVSLCVRVNVANSKNNCEALRSYVAHMQLIAAAVDRERQIVDPQAVSVGVRV